MARRLASEQSRWARAAGLTALVAMGTACAAGDFADPTETSSPGELLNGSPTFARPEVGRLHFGAGGFCTATLITQNVAITAAHCVNFGTQQTEGTWGRFVVDPDENASPRTFEITHYRSFSSRLGWSDVALLRLRQRVPASVAVPTQVSTRSATNGESVTVFGYGCTDRQSQRGGFLKRSFSYAHGNSANLCPGDSGGPVVLGATGPVFLVNSGYYTQSGTDIFGEPWQLERDIQTQISNWTRDLGMPAAPAEVRVTNSSGAAVWVRCDGTQSDECTGWTYLQVGATEGIFTQGRRLVLDNQDYHASIHWSQLHVVAPSDDVTVHPNASAPFTPVAQPDPDPDPNPSPDPDPIDNDDDPTPIDGCMGGANRAGATPLTGAVRGEICANRESWFSVSLRAGESLDVDLAFTHARGDIDTRMLNPAGTEVARSAGTTDSETMRHTAATAGRYTVAVFGYQGAANTVTLRATVGGQADDVCADDGNDALEDATTLTQQQEGRVCDGDTDWFRVDRQGAWTLRLTFEHAQGDLDLRAFDTNGRRIGQSAGTSNEERIQGNGPGYVEIFGYNGAQNGYIVVVE